MLAKPSGMLKPLLKQLNDSIMFHNYIPADILNDEFIKIIIKISLNAESNNIQSRNKNRMLVLLNFLIMVQNMI